MQRREFLATTGLLAVPFGTGHTEGTQGMVVDAEHGTLGIHVGDWTKEGGGEIRLELPPGSSGVDGLYLWSCLTEAFDTWPSLREVPVALSIHTTYFTIINGWRLPIDKIRRFGVQSGSNFDAHSSVMVIGRLPGDAPIDWRIDGTYNDLGTSRTILGGRAPWTGLSRSNHVGYADTEGCTDFLVPHEPGKRLMVSSAGTSYEHIMGNVPGPIYVPLRV